MIRACTTRAAHHLPGRLAPRGALAAAAATASRWSPGDTVTVAFLPGAIPALMEEVVWAAREIERYANLRFAFVGPEAASAMARVATVQDGSSWSLVGKACLLETDQSAPTMNLGWEGDRYRTLHEMLHLADFVHELQLPDAHVPWDVPRVYAYYEGPPNFWTREEVDRQVLSVDTESLRNCGFDPLSQMAYWTDPGLLLDPSRAVPMNRGLSPGDQRCLGLVYPPAAAPAPPPHPPTQEPPMQPIIAALVMILGHLPGDVTKEVDLLALTNAVVSAEIADPGPLGFAHVLGVAGRAVVKDAAAIFPDAIYRTLAVRLLSAIVGPG